MQHAIRKLVSREVGGAEAQDVGDRDRAVRRSHHIADHPADTGVRSTKRLDRRGMVVRLGLDGQRRAFRERHDAGVADEGTAQERRIDRDRRVAQLVHQRLDGLPVAVADESPERLVRTVLAPCLRQRLQLDVGGGPAGRAEVIDDGVQLGEVQRQSTLAVECQQSIVIEPVDLDHLDARVGGGIGVDERRLDRADGPALDHLIGQQPSRQDRHRVVVEIES